MRDMGGHKVDLFWTIVCIIYLYCHLPHSMLKIYEVSNNLSPENCCWLYPDFLHSVPSMQWCHEIYQNRDSNVETETKTQMRFVET